MLTAKTQLKRTRELNRKNFPSEAWFERLLFEHQVGNYSRNPSLIGKYFGDFVWFSHGIVVEIDGISHIGKEDYDKKRDEQLTKAGYKVCRIKMGDRDDATRVILGIKELLSAPSSFRAPPPIYRKPRKIRKLRKDRVIKKMKAVSSHGRKKHIPKCYTDDNAKIIEDIKRRKKLWVHPKDRK